MSGKRLSPIEELAGALVPEIPSPAPGYKTSHQWAAEWRRSLSRTFGIIAARVAAGTMERKVYRLQRDARAFPVPHYREVKPRR